MQKLIINYDIASDINHIYFLKLKKLKDLLIKEQVIPNIIFNKVNCYNQYQNIINKLIPLKVRKFSQNRELKLPNIATVKDGYKSLKFDIENGGNLNKYQSDKIMKAEYNDTMFNYDDLHHFHLDSRIQTKKKYKGLVERSKYIAIAKVTDEEVHIIDIVPHREKNEEGIESSDTIFCNMEYFEKIQDSRSKLIEDIKIESLEPSFYKQREKINLRKNGYISLNTTQSRNVYMEGKNIINRTVEKIVKIRSIEEEIRLIAKELLKYKLEGKESYISVKYDEDSEDETVRIYIWEQEKTKLLIRITTNKKQEKRIEFQRLATDNNQKTLLSDLGLHFPLF